MKFIAKGRITLEDVIFYIEAKDLEEAKEKAFWGKFETYDSDLADTADWSLSVSSVKEDS